MQIVHVKLIKVDADGVETVLSDSSDACETANLEVVDQVVRDAVGQLPLGDTDYDDDRSIETGSEWFFHQAVVDGQEKLWRIEVRFSGPDPTVKDIERRIYADLGLLEPKDFED
jgi:hypothetical protein